MLEKFINVLNQERFRLNNLQEKYASPLEDDSFDIEK